MSNKTLSAATITSPSLTGTITFPSTQTINSTQQIVDLALSQTLSNKTLASPAITGTLTLPSAQTISSSTTLVDTTSTQTLTNKTITIPSSGTLTLPSTQQITSSTTLVDTSSTQTLTNKSITMPSSATLILPSNQQIKNSTTLVDVNSVQSLTNKTISIPSTGTLTLPNNQQITSSTTLIDSASSQNISGQKSFTSKTTLAGFTSNSATGCIIGENTTSPDAVGSGLFVGDAIANVVANNLATSFPTCLVNSFGSNSYLCANFITSTPNQLSLGLLTSNCILTVGNYYIMGINIASSRSSGPNRWLIVQATTSNIVGAPTNKTEMCNLITNTWSGLGTPGNTGANAAYAWFYNPT